METSARVRGNNDFFILKIENSAGAELGRSWSGVEVELATLPAQSSSFLDFLKICSSNKVNMASTVCTLFHGIISP